MLQYTDKEDSGNMRRALHYVLKIGNREASYEFFTKTLGMNVLRHEEFEEGCKATCNGPYDGKWSKTMVGYGPEDNHFVLELTYNYGIGSYKLGSDLKSITITSNAIHNELKANTFLNESGQVELNDPDGRKYIIRQGDAGTALGDITEVAINANDLKLTADFWESICGMHEVSAEHEKYILTAKDSSQWRLKICQSNATTFDRGTAFGRHAFSCEAHELSVIEKLALHKDCNGTVLTPLVSLNTPGKATVQVVILADPDGHEICFVGDEAFRELSQVDPNADDLLLKAIETDQSKQWFDKHGGKPAA